MPKRMQGWSFRWIAAWCFEAGEGLILYGLGSGLGAGAGVVVVVGCYWVLVER